MSQALIEFLFLSIGAAIWIACIIQLSHKGQELSNSRKYSSGLEAKRAEQDFTISVLRAKLNDLEGYYENELAFLKAVTEAQAALLGKKHAELIKAVLTAYSMQSRGAYMGVMLKATSKGNQRENCRNCGAPPQGPVCPYCKTQH